MTANMSSSLRSIGLRQGKPRRLNTSVKDESSWRPLDGAGGAHGSVGYLTWLAKENPSAFAGLVEGIAADHCRHRARWQGGGEDCRRETYH